MSLGIKYNVGKLLNNRKISVNNILDREVQTSKSADNNERNGFNVS